MAGEAYQPDTGIDPAPNTPGTAVPMRPPGGAPEPAPAAPDITGGPTDNMLGTSALGGPQAGPQKPGLGSRVADFITGGQGTPGSVWRGILSGALTGMTAGAGTGHVAQGVTAGAQAATKQAQQQFENQQAATTAAAENKIRQANWVHLNHQIAEESLKASNAKALAPAEAQQYENKINDFVLAHAGSRQIGIVRNPDDMVELHRADPALPQNVARANIVTVPHVVAVTGADGKPTGEFRNDGFYAAYIPSDVKNAPNEQDEEIPIFQPPTAPGKPGTWTTQTIKAGHSTNGEILNMRQKASVDALKYDNDKMVAQAQKAAADAALDAAKAAKTTSDAADLKQQISSQADDVVGRRMDPSQLNKRSKTNDAIKAEVDARSIAQTGQPFDWAKATSDYKDAQGKRVTLDYLTSLTGTDGKSGNLGLLNNLSNQVSRTQFPRLNDTEAWAKLQTGDVQMAQYKTLATEVADQVGKILQGGSGGATSDAKMHQALEMFNSSFTKEQLDGVISTLREALNNRKVGLISNNAYLSRWYGGGGNPIANGAPVQGGAPTVPAGMVSVQLAGHPPGFIKKEQLDKFKKDNPSAIVSE